RETSQSPAPSSKYAGVRELLGSSLGLMLIARRRDSLIFSMLLRSMRPSLTGRGESAPDRTHTRTGQSALSDDLGADGESSTSVSVSKGSSTIKTMPKSTALIESFHSFNPRNSCALPRAIGVVCNKALANSCHGYGLGSCIK